MLLFLQCPTLLKVIRNIVVYILETTHSLLTYEMSGELTPKGWVNPSVKVGFASYAQIIHKAKPKHVFEIFDFVWRKSLT